MFDTVSFRRIAQIFSSVIIYQGLMFGLNLSRDYYLFINNKGGLNEIVIALAVMGFASSALLDLVMVKSFRISHKYGLLLNLSVLFSWLVCILHSTPSVRYLLYSLLSLLYIYNFSIYLEGHDSQKKRKIALIQTLVIFCVILKPDNITNEIFVPLLFYVSALIPMLFRKSAATENYSLISMSYNFAFKIFIAFVLSFVTILISSNNNRSDVDLALRFLSYFITASHLFFPMLISELELDNFRKIIGYWVIAGSVSSFLMFVYFYIFTGQIFLAILCFAFAYLFAYIQAVLLIISDI